MDLLAVQGTLQSLLQHRSSKASNLQCSAFVMAQLSHPYLTTEKSIEEMEVHIQRFGLKTITGIVTRYRSLGWGLGPLALEVGY